MRSRVITMLGAVVALVIGTAAAFNNAFADDPPLPPIVEGTAVLTFDDAPPEQGPTYSVETTCEYITIYFYDMEPGMVAFASVDGQPLMPLSKEATSITYNGEHTSWNARLQQGNGSKVIFDEGQPSHTPCNPTGTDNWPPPLETDSSTGVTDTT